MGFDFYSSESSSATSSTSISKPDQSVQTASGQSKIWKLGENASYVGLDLDALKEVIDFARTVYEGQQLTYADMLNANLANSQAAVGAGQKAGEMIAMAYQTAQGKESPLNYNQLMMYGMALVAVLGLAVLMRKRRK